LATRARKRSKASEDAGPSFIPALVELASTHRRRRQQATSMAAIELDIGDVEGADRGRRQASIVSAVIRALKEPS